MTIIKSRWTIPIPQCTLPTFLFESPDGDLPDTPALLDADNPDKYYHSLRSYRLWAKRFAAGLHAKGFRPGDVVLLYSGNTLFFPVVLLGTIMAGGIFTGANPGYVAREVAYQLQNSGAKFMICAEASAETADEAARIAGLPKQNVFMFDDGNATFDGKGKGTRGYQHWTALVASVADGEKFKWKDTGADMVNDTICLNYSSGTTGLPKGVEITHRNYISNAIQHLYLTTLIENFEEKRKYMRWLCFLPMYHAMAQTIFCVGAVAKRFPIYIMKKFEFKKMLEAVEKFRITDLQLVPPIVVMMSKNPETKKHDISSVERAGSGAAPLGREATMEFEKLWPPGHMNLKQGYGMTEVTCSILGWDPKLHSDSYAVGEPNANCEVKLVDAETGKESEKGQRGELWVRGPNRMKGYWKNEKATKETIVEDGWLRTGDIAYQDENGMFLVVDRMKELIKVKGNQVAPAELEAQLLEHPGISDACVVGVAIKGEEYPRAYVVTPKNDVAPDSVAEFMATKVSRHKRLTGGVKVVDEIIKNPSGKILRKHYREVAAKEMGDIPQREIKI